MSGMYQRLACIRDHRLWRQRRLAAHLLKGNSGWEPYPVQSLDGGLLASPPPKLPTTVNAA